MDREIILTGLYLKDLEDILGFYAENASLTVKENFKSELINKIHFIKGYPELCQKVSEREGVRRAVFGKFPYKIYFLLNETQIVILRIRHLKMDSLNFEK